MVREFRDFLLRGNVIDLAVAVVIGAAFGAVITSFVGDVLTPLLGLLGVPDFGLSIAWTFTFDINTLPCLAMEQFLSDSDNLWRDRLITRPLKAKEN